MRILNVVECIGNTLPNIISFVVKDDNEHEIIEKAELCLRECIIKEEEGILTDELLDDVVKNWYYYNKWGYQAGLIWSKYGTGI
jgi:hypothetical protein